MVLSIPMVVGHITILPQYSAALFSVIVAICCLNNLYNLKNDQMIMENLSFGWFQVDSQISVLSIIN